MRRGQKETGLPALPHPPTHTHPSRPALPTVRAAAASAAAAATARPSMPKLREEWGGETVSLCFLCYLGTRRTRAQGAARVVRPTRQAAEAATRFFFRASRIAVGVSRALPPPRGMTHARHTPHARTCEPGSRRRPRSAARERRRGAWQPPSLKERGLSRGREASSRGCQPKEGRPHAEKRARVCVPRGTQTKSKTGTVETAWPKLFALRRARRKQPIGSAGPYPRSPHPHTPWKTHAPLHVKDGTVCRRLYSLPDDMSEDDASAPPDARPATPPPEADGAPTVPASSDGDTAAEGPVKLFLGGLSWSTNEGEGKRAMRAWFGGGRGRRGNAGAHSGPTQPRRCERQAQRGGRGRGCGNGAQCGGGGFSTW